MAIEESEANSFHWLMDMLESVEVGLVVLDLDFKVEVWNGFMENQNVLHLMKQKISIKC